MSKEIAEDGKQRTCSFYRTFLLFSSKKFSPPPPFLPLGSKKKVNQECKAYQRKAMQCKEEYNKADSIYVCNSGY